MTDPSDPGDERRGDERLAEITQRLENINEELTDIGIDILREAVANGATSRPPEEKPIAAARRAIDKAIRSLGG